MFNLFKRKKLYKVVWETVIGDTRQDIISARDPAHAWKKIKKDYPFSAWSCVSITEFAAADTVVEFDYRGV